ncbi:glycine zipper domain-containing protein [Tahibacter sp.]|uniref:glycine zipper domain-containing protein n=1 Tax=Tahibacter sp. TaxID=2056211 RepID=UPI0028C3772C|nr:glycine zipper domain-containing protein [Tahibacter sp.]
MFSLFALLLGACATDQQRTRSEGTAAGVVAGAALGRAITGNDRGTAIGAVIGGIFGAVAGNRIAEKKAAYAQREEQLRQSAQRTMALAESTRTQNEQLEHDIAELDRSVRELVGARLSAVSRQKAASANQQRSAALVETIEQQLAQMKNEVERQNQLIAAVQAQDKAQKNKAQAEPSEGMRLVAASLRELGTQTRQLELARLQLQQIDERRAY